MHYHTSFFLSSSFVLVTPVACAFVWNNNNGVIFDATCDPIVPGTTITKKEWIKAEWIGALDLAKDASERMQITHEDAGAGTVESRKSVIDGKDPAYGKFMAYETQLTFRDHFSQVWRGMLEFMNSPPGTGARDAGERGKITVICDEEEEAEEDEALPPCVKGEGDTAYTQFWEYKDGKSCDKEQGPIMHICPLFFSLLPRHAVINKAKTFPNKDAWKAQATTDLLYVKEALYDSLRIMKRDFQMPGAQTLVHEWTHLEWLGSTNDGDQYEKAEEAKNDDDNPKDDNEGGYESPDDETKLESDMAKNVLREYYHWYESSKLAIHDTGRPFKAVGPDPKMFARHLNNADNYAWYASWGYYRKGGWLAWSG